MFLHKKYKDQIIIAQTEQQNDNMIPIQPPPPKKKTLFGGRWYIYVFGMYMHILNSFCFPIVDVCVG